MGLTPGKEPRTSLPERRPGGAHTDRVDALAAWVQELHEQVHATAVAGDARSLQELRLALEAWAKHDPKLEDRLTNQVDVLVQRVDTLAKTVATTATGLAGREGELAAMRRELKDANARVETAVAELGLVDPTPVVELQRAIDALSDDASGLQPRLDRFTDRVNTLAERFDSLAGAVATTNAGVAAHEGTLAELRAELEAGSTRVDSVLAAVRQAIDSLLSQLAASGEPASAATVESLAHRLEALSENVDSLAVRVDSLAGRERPGSVATAGSVEELASRVDAVERDRDAVMTEVTRVWESWASHLSSLDARLHVLASKLGEVESGPRFRSTPGEEVAQLRGEVDDLRLRLASSDR